MPDKTIYPRERDLYRERDALRAELERLKAAAVEIGVAHVAAQTEVERLRAEVKCFVCTDWMKQAEELRAENERLRAALSKYREKHRCHHLVRCWPDEDAKALDPRQS